MLKPEYALMNKIIHDQIGPKGNEKSPSREQIQFLYEVMTGKLIDYALVIWCVMRDFLKFSHESRHIPFPSPVTSIVEAAGMREQSGKRKCCLGWGLSQIRPRPKVEPLLLSLNLLNLQCLLSGSLQPQPPHH